MPTSHVARAEPLVPLAVFLPVPLLLAIGVGRRVEQAQVGLRATLVASPAAPTAAPIGGRRAR